MDMRAVQGRENSNDARVAGQAYPVRRCIANVVCTKIEVKIINRKLKKY